MKPQLKHLTSLMAASLLAVGCTEERPFDQIYKEDMKLQAKSELCSGAEYLYLPSTVEASRTTTATRPHWMGDAKRVKLVCDETELKVVSLDNEDKFGDNPTNSLPVLTIPIEHVDFKCAEDADGKCTQKEEENKDISWNEKRFVKFKAADMKVQEVNWLPEQIGNLFFNCFTPNGESLVAAKVENNAINILLERSYQTHIACAGNISGLDELGFRVRYHYSIVKLDSLSTPNYKAIEYPRDEENTFGFFNTASNKLDVDNNETVSGEKTFINRFAPGKRVKYHLSAGFMKPENQSLIDATKKAVETINTSLQQAQADLQIELVDPQADLMTGDLRVNSIVLEDDPLAMGVIGYGPSAANPKTGEIVHARTVMYLGSIRKYIKNTYDDFVAEKRAQMQKEAVDGQIGAKKVELATSFLAQSQMSVQAMSQLNVDAIAAHTPAGKHNHNHAHSSAGGKSAAMPKAKLSMNDRIIEDQVRNPLNHKVSARDFLNQEGEEDEINQLHKDFIFSKNCYYTADMLDFHGSTEAAIRKLVEELGAREWLDLNPQERQRVLDVVTPFVWVPVLVHEIGHNLGLRHNFSGSEDKDNYYTAEELKKMGITRPIKYSSVMDYSYNTINELPVMGKYDIAALRYGYGEKLELKDGKIVDLVEYRSKKGQVELKPYGFCTDEHVSVNPNCNRFDEGGSLTEIAGHHIRAYQENYTKLNFRNGRRSFSLFDDMGQLARLDRTLGSLRLIFERYESIKNTFGLPDSHPIWEQNEFLKDLKQATVISGQFLASVLKTPDLMCAIAAKANPSQIIALVPIIQLTPMAMDCFDSQNLQLNDQFMVVGSAGKLFQSRKDRRQNNPYMDQIDVRGIWLDKIVALDALVGRKTGISIFDAIQENFLDIEGLGTEVENTLRQILVDQATTEVQIRVVNGQVLKVNLPVSMYNKAEAQNGHRIIEPLDRRLKRVLELPSGHPTFQSVVLQRLAKELPSQEQVANPKSLLNAISVGKARATDNLNGLQVVATQIGQLKYYAPLSNSIAAVQIVLRDSVPILEELGQEKVQAILAAKEKGTPPADDASDAEKAAHAMSKELLQAFVAGALQASDFYEMSLLSM